MLKVQLQWKNLWGRENNMGQILGIYGAGGLGREIAVLAQQICKEKSRWQEIIFIDDDDSKVNINGIKVLSYDDAKLKCGTDIEIVIGVGEPATREKIAKKIDEDQLSFASLVHPGVYIPDSTVIGKGTVIQYGCFISCNVNIGDYVYIQPYANIGHDVFLSSGCVISSGCNIAGGVTVGANSYLAMGCCVKEEVTIGSNSIVGMMSAVYKDLPDDVIAMGNPARVMKNNEAHKVFK